MSSRNVVICNLHTFNPFADAESDTSISTSITSGTVFLGAVETVCHIRIQQRTRNKRLTTLEGLPPDLDFKRLLRALKRICCCNGSIVHDDSLGEIIQLQGDQRNSVFNFLIAEEICNKDAIKIHGV